jgi:flavin reductase (DIM6/NTAB) family NADH-FMN oxidoreductase RutF
MYSMQCLKVASEEHPRSLLKGRSASDTGDIVRAFKMAMRQLASGAALITARHGQSRYGMTATSVTSLSLSPVSLLVCVNQGASIHEPLLASGLFCVNLLDGSQADLAKRFSTKPQGEARFSQGVWLEDEDGLPILPGSIASIACRVADIITHGTHSIVIGNVQRVSHGTAGDPLIYLDGSFGRFMPNGETGLCREFSILKV